MKPKISVILPIHNAEKELPLLVHDCFETICDINTECEIVIIDNASTDATGDFAETLSLEFPQVRVLSQWHALGIEESILNGIQQATGDFLYVYYMLSGYVFPQISFFYEAMPFTDAVLGRFLNKQGDSFVGMAMFKRQIVNALQDAIAYPEEAVAEMQAKSIRYLELRYETDNHRKILPPNESKKSTPAFLRKRKTIVTGMTNRK